YGRTQPIHDRGGKSATTHHRKGRLTMTQGHRRNYTTLTDVTKGSNLDLQLFDKHTLRSGLPGASYWQD
ncbi:hypothetical protein, partial [Novosphingobium sp.]|uniref:hypothetical protein n=1 Tax=Novosphingobium sp. TaxID=1874826 RepID=UPI0035AF3081